jgi:O-antigen/teichoic acid export membrane protein
MSLVVDSRPAVAAAAAEIPRSSVRGASLLGAGAVVFLAHGCDLAAGLAAAALTGRYLGAEGLGELSLLLALFLAANTVADLGASSLLTREVAKEPAAARPRLRIHLHLKLVILGLLAFLLLSIFSWSQAGPLGAVTMGIPFLIFSSLNISLAAALRGIGRVSPLLYSSFPAAVGQTMAAFLLLRQGRGLAALFLVMGAAQAVKLLFLSACFLRGTTGASGEARGGVARLLHSALPFAGVVVLGTAYLKLDVLLLSALAGAVETGFFGAAARFTELLKLLPGAFLAALYPELVRREGEHRLATLGWAAAAGAALLALTAPFLIGLTYGPDLLPARLPLQLLALGLPAAVLNSAMVLKLYARSREGKVLRIFAVGLALKTTLDLLLIPAAGAAGASLALAGSEWLLFLLYRRALAEHGAVTGSDLSRWAEPLAFAAGGFLVRAFLIALYPALYGGDPVARMLHPERLVLAYQLPLFQALVALVYQLADHPLGPRLLSAATGAFATAGAYLLARRLFGRTPARAAAALFLANPLFIIYSLMPYQEPLMLGLLGFGAASYLANRRLAASVFLGLACLTRYESWVVAASLAAIDAYKSRGRRLHEVLLLFGWAPLLWILTQGGLAPPGTYVADTGWSWLRLERLAYFGERIAVHAPFALALAPWGIWLTWRRRQVRGFLAVVASTAVAIVALGHDYPPGSAGVSERAVHLPLAAALFFAAAALAELLKRRRFLGAMLGLLVAVSLALAVRQVKARSAEPEVAGSQAIATYLGQRLGPGERALIVARPVEPGLVRHYLSLIAERKPQEIAEAERLVAALSLPQDYQRLVIALPRGRERLVRAEAWRGEKVALAVVFDDARDRLPGGLTLRQPPEARFSAGRQASLFIVE